MIKILNKIKCLLSIHDWSKWTVVKSIGRYEEKLKRTCSRCGKIHLYEGLTEVDMITRDVSPYKYKN